MIARSTGTIRLRRVLAPLLVAMMTRSGPLSPAGAEAAPASATPLPAGAKATGTAKGWSSYRERGEGAKVAAADVAPIYERVLRFYRPPRNQARWLDLRLLTARPGTSTRRLDRALAERLVALGPRFCLLEEPNSCRGENGAQLRLSEIYAATPDRVRVVVACRLVWFGSEAMDNGSQAFILSRTAKGWLITDRHGAGEP